MTADTFALALLVTSSALNVGLLYLYFRSQKNMKKFRESYHRAMLELEKMRSGVREELQGILESLQKPRETAERLLETLQPTSDEVKKC